jgi:ATP synthase F1 complex assembly factor 1
MLRTTLLRTAVPRTPRATASTSRLGFRALSSSAPRSRDLLDAFEEAITPRELVEKKRKEFEAKYGDKLKKKAAA